MADTWFRGESTTVPPSKAGGAIHDFGDGLYFTNSKEVAELYAKTRVHHGGGEPRVFSVQIDRSQLGRVLDLETDPRWREFLRKPQIPGQPGTTPETLIRMANENYGRFFEQFLKQHGIRIDQYDAVIGPEFVRGGSQLCLLHRNGKPSQFANSIRAKMALVNPPPPPPNITAGRSMAPPGMTRGIVSNQAAMAVVGQMIGAALQSLGDIGIRRQVQKEVETTHAAYIARAQERGMGTLVIITLQEWETPDFNGMRARSLLAVYTQEGATQPEALNKWLRTPQLLQGAPKGWRTYEQYAWIPPRRQG